MIVRAPRPRARFTIIDNRTLTDVELSWAALGLLTYLLSRPDDWQVSVAHLAGVRGGYGQGKAAIRRMLAELRERGYCKHVAVRDARGTITRWDYLIFDIKSDIQES
jgi:hypothetical protein